MVSPGQNYNGPSNRLAFDDGRHLNIKYELTTVVRRDVLIKFIGSICVM